MVVDDDGSTLKIQSSLRAVITSIALTCPTTMIGPEGLNPLFPNMPMYNYRQQRKLYFVYLAIVWNLYERIVNVTPYFDLLSNGNPTSPTKPNVIQKIKLLNGLLNHIEKFNP